MATEFRPLIFVLDCSTDSSGLYFVVLQSRAGSLRCERTAPGGGGGGSRISVAIPVVIHQDRDQQPYQPHRHRHTRSTSVTATATHDSQSTVKAIILTRRIYNDFPNLTSLRVPKVTILTPHSQRSIGRYMYRFLYNDFYFNDRFLLVNSLELALRYNIYGFYSTWVLRCREPMHGIFHVRTYGQAKGQVLGTYVRTRTYRYVFWPLQPRQEKKIYLSSSGVVQLCWCGKRRESEPEKSSLSSSVPVFITAMELTAEQASCVAGCLLIAAAEHGSSETLVGATFLPETVHKRCVPVR